MSAIHTAFLRVLVQLVVLHQPVPAVNTPATFLVSTLVPVSDEFKRICMISSLFDWLFERNCLISSVLIGCLLCVSADPAPPGYQVLDDRSTLGSPASAAPSPPAPSSNGEDMDHQNNSSSNPTLNNIPSSMQQNASTTVRDIAVCFLSLLISVCSQWYKICIYTRSISW